MIGIRPAMTAQLKRLGLNYVERVKTQRQHGLEGTQGLTFARVLNQVINYALGKLAVALDGTVVRYAQAFDNQSGGEIKSADHSLSQTEWQEAIQEVDAARAKATEALNLLDPATVDIALLADTALLFKQYNDVVVIAPKASGVSAACEALLPLKHNEMTRKERGDVPRILQANPDNVAQLLEVLNTDNFAVLVIGQDKAAAHCLEQIEEKCGDLGERKAVIDPKLETSDAFFHTALLPLAIAGVDVTQMLEAANDRFAAFNLPADHHPALTRAALIRALAAQNGQYQQSLVIYNKLMAGFSEWEAALFNSAVADGSENTPIFQAGIGPNWHHQARQQEMEGENKMVIHATNVPPSEGSTPITIEGCAEPLFNGFRAADFVDENRLANGEALVRNDRPVVTQEVPALSPVTFAQMVMDALLVRAVLRELYPTAVSKSAAASAVAPKERRVIEAESMTFDYSHCPALSESALADAVQTLGVERAQSESQPAFEYQRSIDATLQAMPQILSLANKFKIYREFLNIGIGGQSAPGGSALNALKHAFYNLLPSAVRGTIVRQLEAPDTDQINQLLEGLTPGEVGVLVNSLSGGTPETIINMAMLAAKGLLTKDSTVVATSKNLETLFQVMVIQQGYEHLELNPLVGGRFTAFTAWVALVMEIAGLNATAYLEGAKAYRDTAHPHFTEEATKQLERIRAAYNETVEELEGELPAETRTQKETEAHVNAQAMIDIAGAQILQSPGDVEGILYHALNGRAKADKRTVRTMIFTHEAMARDTGLDMNQVWNESAGKEGIEGVTVTMGLEAAEQSLLALTQDKKRFITLVHVKDTGNMAADALRKERFEALKNSLEAAGQAFVVYELKELNERALGAFRFAQTDAVVTYVLDHNVRQRKTTSPFGQPGVEVGKAKTRARLAELKGISQSGSTLPLAEAAFALVDPLKAEVQNAAHLRQPAARQAAATNAAVIELAKNPDVAKIYVAGEKQPRVEKHSGRYVVVLNILPQADVMDMEDGLATSTVMVFEGDPSPANYRATFNIFHGGMDTVLLSGQEDGVTYPRTLEFIRINDAWQFRLRGANDIPLVEMGPAGSQLAVSDPFNDMPLKLAAACMEEHDRSNVKLRNRTDALAVFEETQIRGGVAVVPMTPLEILNMEKLTSSSLGILRVYLDGRMVDFEEFQNRQSPDYTADRMRYWVVFGNKLPVDRVVGNVEAGELGGPAILAPRAFREFLPVNPTLGQLAGVSFREFTQESTFTTEQSAVLGAFPIALAAIRKLLPLGGIQLPAGVANLSGDVQEWIDWMTEMALTMVYYNPSNNPDTRAAIERAMTDKHYRLGVLSDALLSFHIGEEQSRVLAGNLTRRIVAAFDSADGTSTAAANQSLGTFMTIYQLTAAMMESIAQIPQERLDLNPVELHNVLLDTPFSELAKVAVMALHGGHPALYLATSEEQGIYEFRLNPGFNSFVLVDKLTGNQGMTEDQRLRSPEVVYGYPGTSSRPGGRLRTFYELIMAALFAQAIGNRTTNLSVDLLATTQRMATSTKGSWAHATQPVISGSPRLVEAFTAVANGEAVDNVIARLRETHVKGKAGPVLALGGVPTRFHPNGPGLLELIKYFFAAEGAGLGWSGSMAVDLLRTLRASLYPVSN